MTDGSGGHLSHLDERIAAQFEQLGWRPAQAERGAGPTPRHDDPESPVRTVLYDIAAQIDATENRLAERQDALARAVARRLADVFDRLDQLVGDEQARAAAASATADALRVATAELERVEGPVNQVAAALEGVHAALRAQSRILGALSETLLSGSSAAGAGSEVVDEVAALRHYCEDLARRIDDIQAFVLEAPPPAGAPQGDAVPTGSQRPA